MKSSKTAKFIVLEIFRYTVILFLNNLFIQCIALCCVVCVGDPFWETFGKELAQFLDELLRSIEVDVQLDARLFSKIREMIQGLISLHIASLDNQLRNLKKLPESSRVSTYLILCFIS